MRTRKSTSEPDAAILIAFSTLHRFAQSLLDERTPTKLEMYEWLRENRVPILAPLTEDQAKELVYGIR